MTYTAHLFKVTSPTLQVQTAPPVTFVVVTELPKHSLVEWEVSAYAQESGEREDEGAEGRGDEVILGGGRAERSVIIADQSGESRRRRRRKRRRRRRIIILF